ncbi:PTS transporter subunit EIIB, partial [Klebsiella pneumoniae]
MILFDLQPVHGYFLVIPYIKRVPQMSEQQQILSIIDNLGGRENIKDYYHCATRLRFGNDSNLLIVFYVQIMPD